MILNKIENKYFKLSSQQELTYSLEDKKYISLVH